MILLILSVQLISFHQICSFLISCRFLRVLSVKVRVKTKVLNVLNCLGTKFPTRRSETSLVNGLSPFKNAKMAFKWIQNNKNYLGSSVEADEYLQCTGKWTMIREVINTHPTENVQYRFTAIMSVETSIFHSDETSSAPIDWAEDRNFEFKDIGPIENALRNAITGENKEGVECKTASQTFYFSASFYIQGKCRSRKSSVRRSEFSWSNGIQQF